MSLFPTALCGICVRFVNMQFIGLGALSFNYTFPLIITAPPYNWPQISSGLIACAGAAGFFLAFPFTFVSDRVAAYLTRRNNGIREAEMRLVILLPAMVIAPAGLICYGMTAQNKGHWFGYMAGVAMTNWGAYWYFTNTLVCSRSPSVLRALHTPTCSAVKPPSSSYVAYVN